MKHRKTSLVVAATSLLALGSSISSTNAATLVGYEFTGGSAAQTTGTATGSNVSYGSFTGGSGSIGISSFSNTMFVRTNATGGNAAAGDTLAKAIDLGNYATFTLTNSTGSTIDLGSFSYDIWFTAPGSTNTYEMYVMSNAAAFTVGNELGGVVYNTTLVSAPVEAGPATIVTDLSSLGNLATSDSREFRIYFVDNTHSADPIFRVDNITVSAIPEPSSILLSGLALAGLALRRRR